MYVGLFSLKVDKIGITVGDDVKVILMEAKEDHPFVQVELMMPILPVVRVPMWTRPLRWLSGWSTATATPP